MPREKRSAVSATIAPRMLSTEDAERYLGLKPGALRSWRSQGSQERTGRVQPPKVSKPSCGRDIYDIKDLDEWCDNLPREQTP